MRREVQRAADDEKKQKLAQQGLSQLAAGGFMHLLDLHMLAEVESAHCAFSVNLVQTQRKKFIDSICAALTVGKYPNGESQNSYTRLLLVAILTAVYYLIFLSLF